MCDCLLRDIILLLLDSAAARSLCNTGHDFAALAGGAEKELTAHASPCTETFTTENTPLVDGPGKNASAE